MRAAEIAASHCDTSPSMRSHRISLQPKSAVDHRQLKVMTNVIEVGPEQAGPSMAFKMTPKQPNPSWFSNDRLDCASLKSEDGSRASSGSQVLIRGDANRCSGSSIASTSRPSLTKERIDEINRRLSTRGSAGSGLISAAAQASRQRRESPSNGKSIQSKGSSGVWPTPSQQGRPPLEKGDSEIRFVNGTRVVSGSGCLTLNGPMDAHLRASLSRDASGMLDTRFRERSSIGTLKEMLGSSIVNGSGELSRGHHDDFEYTKTDLTFREMLQLDKVEGSPIPSCGPQLARVINVRGGSPFKDRDMQNITAKQISHSLDMAYSSAWERLRAQYFQQSSGDVIVVSPPRSGQTPILKALDMMLHSHEAADFSEAAFTNRVGWVGSTFSSASTTKRRLFKSHLPLEFFMKQAADADMDAKIVVMLRDPLALRESWFRHCKTVFQHFHPDVPFNFAVEDFALLTNLPQGRGTVPSDSQHSRTGEDVEESSKENSFEHYVASVLKYAGRNNVHIVFYEDFVSRPVQVLQRLEEFVSVATERPPRMTAKSIAAILTNGKKPSLQAPVMRRSVLAKLQNHWDFEIATKGPWHFVSYAALHEQLGLGTSIDEEGRANRFISRLSMRPKSKAYRTGETRSSKSSEDDQARSARTSILKGFASIFEKRKSTLSQSHT